MKKVNIKKITARCNVYGNWSVFEGTNKVKEIGLCEWYLREYLKENYPNRKVTYKY